VRRYLERNGGLVKLLFLQPYSPFLNPAEWLWRKGKARICRTFRQLAKSYSADQKFMQSMSLF